MAIRYEKIIHIIYWIWFLFSPALYWYLNRQPVIMDKLFEPLKISQFFIGMIVFYFQYLIVMPNLLKNKRQIGSVILWSFITLFIYIILRYAIEEILFLHFLGYGNYDADTTFSFYAFDNIYFGGRYLIVATLFWLIINYAKVIEERNALQKAQSAAEINFLRTQINPHFLFNTINNIYSLVYHKSDQALPAIEKLGELMRYMTSEQTKGKVELEREIEYLKSSIELNALRYSEKGSVELNISGDLKNKEIAPFVLLPFAENAFKHGVATEPDCPIKINIEIVNNRLKYSCRNKISGNHTYTESSGIGLINLERRLNLQYAKNYTITTKKEEGYFYAKLEITL